MLQKTDVLKPQKSQGPCLREAKPAQALKLLSPSVRMHFGGSGLFLAFNVTIKKYVLHEQENTVCMTNGTFR